MVLVNVQDAMVQENDKPINFCNYSAVGADESSNLK